MTSNSVIICLVVCASFCFRSNDLVNLRFSFVGILTHRSLMSYINILKLLFNLSFVKTSSRFMEFFVVIW